MQTNKAMSSRPPFIMQRSVGNPCATISEPDNNLLIRPRHVAHSFVSFFVSLIFFLAIPISNFSSVLFRLFAATSKCEVN